MAIERFSPNKLNVFRQCPHRYYRKYVKHDLPIGRETSALARGRVTHNLLATALRHRMRGRDFPFDLRKQIAADLPSGLYQTVRDWQDDVEQVSEWVSAAEAIYRDAEQIVAIERRFTYESRGTGTIAPFQVYAQLDAVFRHADGAYEHVDWKTGGDSEDSKLQTVLSRIVLACNIPDRPRTYSTTMFFASGELRRQELTRNDVTAGWAEITGLVAAIQTERQWPATANYACGSCPLYERGCPIFTRES